MSQMKDGGEKEVNHADAPQGKKGSLLDDKTNQIEPAKFAQGRAWKKRQTRFKKGRKSSAQHRWYALKPEVRGQDPQWTPLSIARRSGQEALPDARRREGLWRALRQPQCL